MTTATLEAVTQTFTGDNAFQRIGIGALPSASYMFQIVGNHPSTGTNLYGQVVQPTTPSTCTNWMVGTYTQVKTAAASFTCGLIVGHQVGPPVIGSGSTINNVVGFDVRAQSGGAVSNIGIQIGASTGTNARTLWVSADADSTTAPGGIFFGSSADTNLYRSAANTLKTDDAFVAGQGFSQGVTAHGNTGATETIDISTGKVHTLTLDTNAVTVSFSNWPSGVDTEVKIYVKQDATGGRVPTFSGVIWPGGIVPTFSTAPNAKDIVVISSDDGGTTKYGNVVGKAYA